jgi:hypothetical protein
VLTISLLNVHIFRNSEFEIILADYYQIELFAPVGEVRCQAVHEKMPTMLRKRAKEKKEAQLEETNADTGSPKKPGTKKKVATKEDTHNEPPSTTKRKAETDQGSNKRKASREEDPSLKKPKQ